MSIAEEVRSVKRAKRGKQRIEVEIIDQSQKSLDEIVSLLEEQGKTLEKVAEKKFPAVIRVTNLQKYPEKMEITNPVTSVEVSNLKDIHLPEFPTEMRIAKPDWYSPAAEVKMDGVIKAIQNIVLNLDAYTKNTNPLAVKLTYEGKEYMAMGGGGGNLGVPELLPIRIVTPAGDSAMDEVNDAVRVNIIAGGAGNGSILDGVDNTIKASVLDYANSNPLAVRLTDTNGDYIAAGAGTQYTEDAAAAANPVGTVPILVRNDTPVGEVTDDGDNIAQRGTNYGAAYVTLLDTAGAPVSVGGGPQYTEDAAAPANPIGTALVLVREDARAGGLTTADGDNVVARGNNKGEMYVKTTDSDAILTTIDADTGNISTKIDTIAGAVSGSKVQTDIDSLPNGLLDSFGHLIIGEINNDIDVQFYRATSDSNLSNIITETEANGGTASRSNGMATFAATATANSRAKGVSLVPVVYTAGAEVYAIFTAAFPTATGGAGSYRRIGLYNDLTDGLLIGYETTGTFGVSIIKGGVQTTTLKASFSNDTLVGGAGSKFTRAGVPEAIDLTKLNVFRIRFGWVGSAPIKFEVLSPDGKWVLFHTILQPNLAAIPSLNTADIYFTCDVNSGTSGNSQSILSNCWGAGTTQKLRKITDTITSNTLAGLTRSVITGETTGGGGGFVNVKVTPSGALVADITAKDLDIRNLVFATDKVDASGSVLGAGNNNIGDVDVASIAAGDNNIGNVDIVTVPTDPFGANADAASATGSISAKLRGIATALGITALDLGSGTGGSRTIRVFRDTAQFVGGTGVDTSATQRVSLATNVALPAGNNNIGDVDIASIAAGDNNIGNVDVVTLPSIPAGTNNIGDVDVLTVPADPFGANADAIVAAGAAGSIQAKLRRATQGLEDLKSLIVLAAGTNAIGKLAANSGVDIGDVDVVSLTGSSIAHDGVDSGNPHKIGGKAVAHGTNPTAVAAADRTDWYFNRAGVPFVIGGHPNVLTKQLNITDADGAQTDTAIVTVGAGAKIVVTHITVALDSATTASGGVAVRIGFGTSNTPAADSAGIVLSHPGIAAGSGLVVGNGGGIIGVGADNEDLRITCEDPVGGNLDIVVGYYTIES